MLVLLLFPNKFNLDAILFALGAGILLNKLFEIILLLLLFGTGCYYARMLLACCYEVKLDIGFVEIALF